MKKLLCFVGCVALTASLSLARDRSDLEVMPAGSSGSSTGSVSSSGGGSSAGAVNGGNSSTSSSGQKEVRPAGSSVAGSPGGGGSPGPAAGPAPHGGPHYGYTYRYYYDPYYDDYFYGPPRRTVIIYQQTSPTYVSGDTMYVENPFPVRFTLGIQGIFGAYMMTSDYNGYDFTGLIWGGGLSVQVPINSTSAALVTGLSVYYHRLSENFEYYSGGRPTGEDARYTFQSTSLGVPILLRLRATGSRFSFDFGGKILFNIRDRLKIKDDSGSDWIDLDDERNVANFALAIGFNVDINRYLAFNIGADFAFGEMYDASYIEGLPADYGESSFWLGFTFNFLN